MSKAIISVLSDGGNIYTVNREKKLMFLTHPDLVPHLYEQKENIEAKEGNYYARKARYLKEHGCLEGLGHRYDGEIGPELVEYGLAHLKQLVFEVTDGCNLRCKYCAYGELYGDYDERHARKMNFDSAKKVIDFLVEIWNHSKQESTSRQTFFSFYGGEPLLNMPLVKQVTEYVESLSLPHINIAFSMTTNAMLLDKHIDFLAAKKFHLLISLDGNKWNNSYRETADGGSSFERNISNVDELKRRYPEYFDKYVNFNAVLHNRNTPQEIYHFIKDRYGKVPRIAALNPIGVRPEKQEEFKRMYQSVGTALKQSEEYEVIINDLFMNAPEYYEAGMFIGQYSPNVYRTYNELFVRPQASNMIPTGTCTPFNRKMYVSVNGKILACERIGQQYGLATVSEEEGMNLSYQKIADIYNRYFDKLRDQCRSCYQSQACTQCMFTIENIEKEGEQVECPDYADAKNFASYISRNFSFLETHPAAYKRVMEVIIA